MSRSRQAALSLAQRGLPVFRLRRGTKDHFIDTAWAKGGATADGWELDARFPATEEFNIGVLATGCVVLDVDCKTVKGKTRNGFPELAALEAEHGKLPTTYVQRTPSGGLHYVFDAGGEAYGQRDLSPGINVRATNGYFLGAGSVFEGKEYTVEVDAAPAPLPEWLRRLLFDAPTKDLNAGRVHGELDTDTAIASATAYLKGSAPPSIEGQGGDLNAYMVACQCLDRGVSPATCLSLMIEHWNSRCEPEWDEDELQKKVDSATVNRQKAIGSDNPADGFCVIDVDETDGYFAQNVKVYEDTPETIKEIPPRAVVVEGFLTRGDVTVLGAPGSAGKSAFAHQLAAAVATKNDKIVGRPVREACNVLLVNNEDDEDEMRRRQYAVFDKHNIPHEGNRKKIHYFSGKIRKFRMCQKTGKGTSVTDGEMLADLIKHVKKHEIGVVVFDPLASMHDSNESDNSDMARVMDKFTSFAGELKVAVMIPHHTVKPPNASAESYAGNVNAVRGASAIKDAARKVVTGFRMSEKEGERYEVDAAARHAFVRFDDAKSNHSAMANGPTWFQMCSVTVAGESVVALNPVTLTLKIDKTAKTICEAMKTRHGQHVDEAFAELTNGKGFHASSKADADAVKPAVRRMLKEGVCVGGHTITEDNRGCVHVQVLNG